jgi:hypothetical protein
MGAVALGSFALSFVFAACGGTSSRAPAGPLIWPTSLQAT